MINIDDKLYVTKEINAIIVSYAKDKVLRKLLKRFSFKENTKKISDLLQDVSYYNGDAPPLEQQDEMETLIFDFLKQLKIEELTALRYWVLNNKYSQYFQETEIDDMGEGFDQKFGRELAYKLYDPKSSQLDCDMKELLYYRLINFASEFDLSVIDKHTKRTIKDTINNYCNYI